MMAMMPVNVKLALRSLNRNRLRTLLTMLGIIIGVAAVLTMVALGTGARASVESEVTSAGTNIVYVRSGNYTRGGESVGIASGRGAATTLIAADGEAIQSTIPGVSDTSPGNSVRTFVAAGSNRVFARIQGIAPSYARIYSWNFSTGEMLASATGQEAVVGSSLAAQMFGPGFSPLGQTVQVRDVTYTVVGVTDSQAEDHSEVLFVPWITLQNSLGIGHLDSITVAAERAGEASRIAEDIRSLLRQRHGLVGTGNADTRTGYLANQGGVGGVPDDFTVETQAAEVLTRGLYTPAAAFALANLPKLDQVTLEEMADTLDRASGTMTALLASIAGASLVVGGIGIMNIMLVSITERTREIGLRMATGARGSDVATQFLIEAVTLSSIGGLLGLGLGLVSARLVSWSLGWPATVTVISMVLALGIAALVGLIFGYYPARRASLLDPIDALRTE